MAIEREGRLDFSARYIMHFLVACENLSEARRSLPDLTQEQFDKLRNGDAHLEGSSNTGLNYVEHS